MKKLFIAIFALFLLFVLVGCNNTPTPTPDDNPGGNTDNPGGNTDNPGGETDNPGGETDNPGGNTDNPGGNTDNPGGNTDNPGGGKTRKTVITYCNWNFGTEEENNLTRRRVEAFNKQSTTVRIELITPVEGTSYDEFLATLAAGGELPDVFMVNSVPTAVINQWALDITSIASADAEWTDIPEALRDSITYNGHIFAVPAGQYYMGLFANLDLIDDYLIGNKTAEEMFAPGEFTTEEWIKVVKGMRDINHQDGTGVIGMNAVGDMINWLPATLDTTGKTKHFTWNGSSFDFRSEALLDAFRIIADLGDKNSQYVFDSIPATEGEGDDLKEVRSLIFGQGGAADVFLNGQMGFIQEGSWAGTFENTDFNCIFTSYPDKRVIAATDFMCISKSSKNPELAYEVAKFLTFGAAGAQAMFDIIDNNPDAELSVTCIPLNTKKEISDKWFTYIKMNGLQEVFDAVNEGKVEVIVEGNKTVPGFLKARYTFNTGISIDGVREGSLLTIGDFIWDTCGGSISINDYLSNMSADLAKRINDLVKADFIAMGLEYPEE